MQRIRRSPPRTKLFWAAGGIGSEALAQSRNVWLVYYYAPPADADRAALLSLTTVSALLFAGKLIEAFDDALIGWWSDRTRSRLGRRLPFILLATPLWALLAFLAFTPPADAGAAAVAVYFVITLELFYLAATLSGGPYEALLPELAATSRDRVALSGLRIACGVLGAAIGLVGSGLLVETLGFRTMALLMAALALGFRYLGMLAIWNHVDRDRPPAVLPLRAALRATFSNRHFLRFLPAFVLFQVGLTMLVGLLPYYVNAVLKQDDEGVWVALLTALSIGAMVAAVPLFVGLARVTSKQQAYRTAMLASALAFPLLFVAGFVPGVPPLAQVIVAMLLVGAPLAGVYLFPAPLLADICDHDARMTGMRREATFFGAQAFAEKATGALAPLMLALLLLLGNSAENPLGVRLVGPVAGLIVLAGYLLFRGYTLPDDVARTAMASLRDLPAEARGVDSS